MAIKLKSLTTDTSIEEAGDWIASYAYPGVEWFLCSTEMKAYRDERDRRFRDLLKKFGGKPAPQHEVDEILSDLFAKHIVKDWRGLDVPFSEAQLREIMTSDEYRDVKGDIMISAAKVGKRDIEFVEESAKN